MMPTTKDELIRWLEGQIAFAKDQAQIQMEFIRTEAAAAIKAIPRWKEGNQPTADTDAIRGHFDLFKLVSQRTARDRELLDAVRRFEAGLGPEVKKAIGELLVWFHVNERSMPEGVPRKAVKTLGDLLSDEEIPLVNGGTRRASRLV